MKQYRQTLEYVVTYGKMRSDRTGKGRHGLFSPPDEIYDLKDGFPLLSMRELNIDAVIDELLWFVSGSTRSKDMKFKFFWDKWTAKESDAIKYAKEVLGICGETDQEILSQIPHPVFERIGTIGNLYGVSWRNAPGPVGDRLPQRAPQEYPRKFVERLIPVDDKGIRVFEYEEAIEFLTKPVAPNLEELKRSFIEELHTHYWSNYDQLNELLIKLKKNPTSSRLRVTAYLTDYMAFEEFSPQENVMDGRAALTPCHTFFQCYVNPGEEGEKPCLDLKLTLTSSDVPVGRPYNIAQYALLCMMLAHCCDMNPGHLIVSSGDTHIYGDQFEAVHELLSREDGVMPTMELNPAVKDLFAFKREDFTLKDYNPQPKIDIPVAV